MLMEAIVLFVGTYRLLGRRTEAIPLRRDRSFEALPEACRRVGGQYRRNM